MTKKEFLIRYEEDQLDIGEYIMILDKISDASLVMGCALDDGVWKVYKTKERDGHYVISEFKNESDAFDFFYELILCYHERRK